MPFAVWSAVTVPVSVTVRPGSTVPGRVVGLLAHDADPLAHPDRAVPDPPDRHPADVLVRRQVRDQQLERVVRRVPRRRRDVDQDVEEGPEVGARARRGRCVAVPALAFV